MAVEFKTKLKVGIVGVGTVAIRDYLPVLMNPSVSEAFGFETIALCDLVKRQLDRAQSTFSKLRTFTSFEEMLDDDEIEVIAILTPIQTHFMLGRMALNAGKHVYFQKTMCRTRDEAEELISLSQQYNRKIVSSPMQIMDRAYRIAKALTDSGELGEIIFARARGSHVGHENQFTFDIDPSWYYEPGAGPVYDVAVYPLHSLTGIIGPVKRVIAMGAITDLKRVWQESVIQVLTEDTVMITLDFGGGRFAQVDSVYGMLAAKTPQYEIYFTNGVIHLGGWLDHSTPIAIYDRKGVLGSDGHWKYPCYSPYAKISKCSADEFGIVGDLLYLIEAIHSEAPTSAAIQQALHVIEVCEAIYLSIKSGCVQDIQSTF